MTHATLLLATGLAALLAGPASAAERAWNGDVDLLLAGKRLNSDDWGPDDRQGEIGLMTNLQPPEWPVALAADLLFSGHDFSARQVDGFTEQRGSTSELDLGARKIWRPDSNARPYLGGGLAIASAELERRGPLGSAVSNDSGAGLWLGGGIFWTVSKALNVGLDAKVSGVRVRLFDSDRNAGGFHLGLLLGYHWGG